MSEHTMQFTFLQDLSLAQLRAKWRENFGAPPPIRSRDLLCRALAERMQEAEFGGDPVLAQRLRTEVARLRPNRKPYLPRSRYRPGSVLEKEWQGSRHHVEVLADGYRWRGQNFASLSAVARAITGVRWSGPRFFGLRKLG
jgi:hypothetical protein